MGRDFFEIITIDGRIILNWILNEDGMNWFYLAYNKIQWWVCVSMVIKFVSRNGMKLL
jgi:hypothetical protein